MSISKCPHCDKLYDQDYEVEHEEVCKEDNMTGNHKHNDKLTEIKTPSGKEKVFECEECGAYRYPMPGELQEETKQQLIEKLEDMKLSEAHPSTPEAGQSFNHALDQVIKLLQEEG